MVLVTAGASGIGRVIAENFLAQKCKVHVCDIDQHQRRFLQLWTLKESYIKARGMGLALPLRQFAFTDVDDTPRISFSADLDDQPSRWQFCLRTIGETHLLALAVEASPPEKMNIVIREWEG